MREKLLEAARLKFKELERLVDEASIKNLDDLAERQRRLIAHGNYLRKLEREEG